MVDALAQRRAPSNFRGSRVKFNSGFVLAKCIDEAVDGVNIEDGQSLEVLNECIEWSDYECLEACILKNAASQTRKQNLTRQAINVSRII